MFGYELLWVPSRVTLDDGGVLLRSPCRRVSIAWEDLVMVERLGGKSRKVKWRRTKGLAVSATDEFVDLRRLLTAIERRALHVAVYG